MVAALKSTAYLKPRAIDLFCGLGGFTEGFLAEGYDVVGFDNERHIYGDQKYPAQLVLQDVLTIHGKQFKDAAVIVASPPCQEYSYMAMPWKRGKQIAEALRGEEIEIENGPAIPVPFPDGYTGSRSIDELNTLFNACFRIQREACEAAGRYIPMVVENVKGAQPWVGPAKAHFGSFYLWGDVGMVGNRVVAGSLSAFDFVAPRGKVSKVPGFRFDGSGRSFQTASVKGTKHGGDWFSGKATVAYGGNFGWDSSPMRMHSSKSSARKAASAQIAKIPLALSSYIARAFKP